MRILIYGAGVIGCLYGALFSEAGHEVTVYARGRRLKILEKNGLRYRKGREVRVAEISVLEHLTSEDRYDYIFLAVKENQLHEALKELSENQSPCIFTMVNSLESYDIWEALCGKGRIVPGFPGAGGGWKEDVLDASLTPAFIQPTTFAEIDGKETPRTKELSQLFRSADIPIKVVKDMRAWQLCHLAMVVPLADAYYRARNAQRVYEERSVMAQAAQELKSNFKFLKDIDVSICPSKHRIFLWIPENILTWVLTLVYRSDFADRFMYQHSMKAPDEMRALREKFYRYREDRKNSMKDLS